MQSDFIELFTNVSAISVYPTLRFIQWIRKIDPTFVIADVDRVYGEVFLIPCVYNPKDVKTWVMKNFDVIFKDMMSFWSETPRSWPRRRTFKMFNEWFEWEEFHRVRHFYKTYPLLN